MHCITQISQQECGGILEQKSVIAIKIYNNLHYYDAFYYVNIKIELLKPCGQLCMLTNRRYLYS